MQESLGRRIVLHRKRLGLTQDQLAEQLGVTAQAVSKWENDQSCPDISVLPQLADIFGISLDVLLGRIDQEPTDNVQPSDQNSDRSNWEWSLESKRRGIALATCVIFTGVLLLLSAFLGWGLSVWDALWPTALLMFGLFSLYPNFSFSSLVCTLLGAYFIVDKIIELNHYINSKVIWSCVILLLGISLLIDTIRNKRNKCHFRQKPNKKGSKKAKLDYEVNEQQFTYHAAFSENTTTVILPVLEQGDIEVSFGDYCIDLRHVKKLASPCLIRAECSFGDLKLIVPARYSVQPHSSTVFSGITVKGSPSDLVEGIIRLDADVSFGEIEICYI